MDDTRLTIERQDIMDVVNNAVSVDATKAGRRNAGSLEFVFSTSVLTLAFALSKSMRVLAVLYPRVGGISPASRAATTLRIPGSAHAPPKCPHVGFDGPNY